MSTIKRTFLIIVIASLLTACSGESSSIWGNPPSPTPHGTPDGSSNGILPQQTPTLTPTGTPLMVLPLQGTSTVGPPVPTPTLPPVNISNKPLYSYKSQSGDTLTVAAHHFGVSPNDIVSDVNLPSPNTLLAPGTLLLIPDKLPDDKSPDVQTMPDSEVVYSPSTVGFDVEAYVAQENGYLNQHPVTLSSTSISGGQAVLSMAQENSINPRLLLAIMEYESHWVRSNPGNIAQNDYPLGYVNFLYKGIYRQMMWASTILSDGYYGWRAGTLTQLTFPDGSHLRLAPTLNAGTVAIQYFFAQTRNRSEWENIVTNSFPKLYSDMFGDPWERAKKVEPLLPAGLQQPPLSLPFEPGKVWSLTGGPHAAYLPGAQPLSALDLAPATDKQGCYPSADWILAPIGGVIVRSETGLVMLDVDGDGNEQTGWDIMFLHVATQDRIPVGRIVVKDDKIGHPSCEGGDATGTHVHIARKYNGEWILADGPIPFDLSGWIAHSDESTPYRGYLSRGDEVITACSCGDYETRIIRGPND